MTIKQWVAWGVLLAISSQCFSQVFSRSGTDASVLFRRVSDGKTLYQEHPARQLHPASVTKLLTGAAAFAHFGPEWRFSTEVFYRGTVQNQQLVGDLYIQGGGDPMLVSQDVWRLMQEIQAHGIESIQGNVYLDDTMFAPELVQSDRKDAQVVSTNAYDASVSALGINFNTLALTLSPGKRSQPANVSFRPYALPAVRVNNRSKTVIGSRNRLWVERKSDAQGNITVYVRGNMGQDASPKTYYRSFGQDTRGWVAATLSAFFERFPIPVSGRFQYRSTPTSAKRLL